MKKNYLLTGLALLLMSFGITAQQVTLTTPSMLVEPGDEIVVPIKVEDFTDILGVQFAIRWNPQVLKFALAQEFMPEGILSDAFNLNDTTTGKIRFGWIGDEYSLTDQEPIVSMTFKVVGAPNSATLVEVFGDTIFPEFPVEVTSNNGIVVANINNGTVTVNGPNAAHETKTEVFTLFQNSPNPFIDETFISFSLNETTDAVLSIYDNSGKTILRQDGKFNRGMHRIPVQRNLFNSAGSYFYSLETEKSKATRKLIAQ